MSVASIKISGDVLAGLLRFPEDTKIVDIRQSIENVNGHCSDGRKMFDVIVTHKDIPDWSSEPLSEPLKAELWTCLLGDKMVYKWAVYDSGAKVWNLRT